MTATCADSAHVDRAVKQLHPLAQQMLSGSALIHVPDPEGVHLGHCITHLCPLCAAPAVSSQPDAAAEHELALGESLQHTERVAKAPSMSEEDYVEAGAKELQQLYADMAPDMCRLLSQQRLVLVLDLDHTLVNSARQTEIDPEHVLVMSNLMHDALC